jgi:hypothetical protein
MFSGDRKYDHLIEKVSNLFDSSITKKNTLHVLIDRDELAKLSNKPKIFNTIYLKDPSGQEWKSPFIPIGFPKMDHNADEICIL